MGGMVNWVFRVDVVFQVVRVITIAVLYGAIVF